MHWKRGTFEKDLKKSVSWVLRSEEEGWLSRARSGLVAGATHVWGGRWKSQHRKIVPLSSYVEKPLNSKVIKSFVPEQRSRKCFCVSGFLCSIYICALWTFYVRFTYSCMAMLQWKNTTRIDKPWNLTFLPYKMNDNFISMMYFK